MVRETETGFIALDEKGTGVAGPAEVGGDEAGGGAALGLGGEGFVDECGFEGAGATGAP
jgi:hypothetical protein